MSGAQAYVLTDLAAGKIRQTVLAERWGITPWALQDRRLRGTAPRHTQPSGKGGTVFYDVDSVLEHERRKGITPVGPTAHLTPSQSAKAAVRPDSTPDIDTAIELLIEAIRREERATATKRLAEVVGAQLMSVMA